MSDNQQDKFSKKSISFPESLAAEAQKRAQSNHGGNLSRYIQSLVEKDLKGRLTPLPTQPDPLDLLVSSWNPGFTKVVSRWSERHSLDQSQFVAQIVWEICQAALEDRDPHRFLRDDFPAAAEDKDDYGESKPRRAC